MKGIKKIVLTVILAILLLFAFSLIMYFAFGVQRSKPVVNEYNDVIESYENNFVNSELDKLNEHH
tara:strand:+ start:279 stop:473 length:195 start_codon:yes stop_codon:yes gene_type:complete